jgi:hypothetical protein
VPRIGSVYAEFTRLRRFATEAKARRGVIWPHVDGRAECALATTRGMSARHGMRHGIDGIAVGLNAVGLLCIGAGNDYVCRAAMSPLT